jgi:succinate dehydrogenase / fumarate reductase iron-sulfur subunit
MTTIVDKPETNDPPLPPVPDGAVMVTMKIARFNPEHPDSAGFESFRVPCLPSDRLLNLLHYVKWYLDGTLTFRRSCAHGVCGSDAMRINGVNRLACKVLMRDLLPKTKPGKAQKPLTITIEPIRGLPVEKDLVVDMEPFFDAFRAVKPFLMTSGNPPTKERIQSQTDRARYDDTTKCILCACCTTSCPVFWNEGSYFGPAAIVNAHRFIFDSRDEGAAERLDILNEVDGVWRCRTTFNCTESCPRGIQVTKAIQEVKRALLFAR